MNGIRTWQQGAFVDQEKYRRMSEDWKETYRRQERHLVRPAPTDNAICYCPDPEMAKWIAQRLNLASLLEEMTYDFATGKADGQEIIDLVRANVG